MKTKKNELPMYVWLWPCYQDITTSSHMLHCVDKVIDLCIITCTDLSFLLIIWSCWSGVTICYSKDFWNYNEHFEVIHKCDFSSNSQLGYARLQGWETCHIGPNFLTLQKWTSKQTNTKKENTFTLLSMILGFSVRSLCHLYWSNWCFIQLFSTTATSML